MIANGKYIEHECYFFIVGPVGCLGDGKISISVYTEEDHVIWETVSRDDVLEKFCYYYSCC